MGNETSDRLTKAGDCRQTGKCRRLQTDWQRQKTADRLAKAEDCRQTGKGRRLQTDWHGYDPQKDQINTLDRRTQSC